MNNACGPSHHHHCGTLRAYAYAFDAFYCPNCDLWLDPICSLRDCILCLKRAPRPSGNSLCKKKDQAA